MLLYDNSKVTVELREIVESGVNIWDFEYNGFYTGDEKTAFERKVIDHYYFRQIGQETVGRWLHMFRTRVKEIMPYYVQLYGTVKIMEGLEDPFANLDVTETFEQQTSGTRDSESSGSSSGEVTGTNNSTTDTENSGSTSSESENESEDNVTGSSTATKTAEKTANNTHSEEDTRLFSNTPQGDVSNLFDGYLTEATKDSRAHEDENTESVSEEASESNTEKTTHTGSSTTTASSSDTGKATTTGTTTETSTGSSTATGTETSTGTVTHTLHRKGNQGVNTYAHDMLEYRRTLLNIDMLVIAELKDLFLQVY